MRLPQSIGETSANTRLANRRGALSQSWMGKLEEPDSVASTLKHTFDYDLSRTKGLRPRFKERLLEHFQAEGAKYLVGAFFSLLSVIGVWLAYLLNRYLSQLAYLLETIKP